METNEQLEDQVKNLLHEFEYSSDRAAVIVSMSFVEDFLRKNLKHYFIQDKETLKRLFSATDADATFSTLGSIVDLGYLLGLMPDEVRKNIKLLAHIRNRFAHEWNIGSFDDLEKYGGKTAKKNLEKLRRLVPSESDSNKKSPSLREAYKNVFLFVLIGVLAFAKHVSEQRRAPYIFSIDDMGGEALVKSLLKEQLRASGAIHGNEDLTFAWTMRDSKT